MYKAGLVKERGKEALDLSLSLSFDEKATLEKN